MESEHILVAEETTVSVAIHCSGVTLQSRLHFLELLSWYPACSELDVFDLLLL